MQSGFSIHRSGTAGWALSDRSLLTALSKQTEPPFTHLVYGFSAGCFRHGGEDSRYPALFRDQSRGRVLCLAHGMKIAWDFPVGHHGQSLFDALRVDFCRAQAIAVQHHFQLAASVLLEMALNEQVRIAQIRYTHLADQVDFFG